MPYVSVIIPAFNAADFIIDAYRSIEDQTTSDWEAIFVNDGSQDNTLDVVRTLAAADKRVKVVDLPSNSGPAGARNAAVAIAEGDWIAVLDADDKYSPDRLEALTRAGERSAADVVMDNQFVVDPVSRRAVALAFEPPKEEVTTLEFVDYLRNTQSNTFFDFGYLKPVIRRRWMAANHIQYQDKLRLGEDLMLLFECYACRAKVVLVTKPYYHYYLQYSQVSRKKSSTTKTDANYAPMVAATEAFLEKHGSKQSQLERRLIASTCEALREVMLVTVMKARLRQFDVIGLVGCLCHPIRLFRGVYFEKRRSFLFWRQARTIGGRTGVARY
jgi:succinoglycan biosynthesis protein ExoO